MTTKKVHTKNMTRRRSAIHIIATEMANMLAIYKGRFTKKNKKLDDSFSWIYDNVKEEYILRIVNLNIKDIQEEINQYLIEERNTKINELGL